MPQGAKARGCSVTEAELTVQIIAAAHQLNWKCVHWRPALTSHGWRTAVQGDGVGWPDLTFARDGRLIFAELKSRGKEPTPAQEAWLALLGSVPGCQAFVWRPADWESGEIVRVLLGRIAPPPPHRMDPALISWVGKP